ncbi:GlcG/HbpS family heme-binding protein [Gluconacetobacter tumulisoli]|nr:heme-binding protein [Gluconacetobacter tumulisoli]
MIRQTAAEAREPGTILTLEQARTMARAAERKAAENHTSVAVTVVDGGGYPILVERMEGTQLASLTLADRKARSAVFYKRPSGAFEQALTGGKMAVLALPDAMPAAGGIPVLQDGQVVGAIGVSGGSNAQDQLAAEAGMTTLPAHGPN